ncbi:MAG: hypothetical protein BMS9Abin07_0945 [Acidimicrobiia bacterium]|nr:MAG: hypothetical protein BMS9Abin07_0945 [Acidimicrobiia bacterium]
MRPITNPLARIGVHVFLWAVVLYSTAPFIWTILNSFKTKRDANAATPKLIFDPTLRSYADVLLKSAPDNGVLIGFGIFAIVLMLVVVGFLAKRLPLPTKYVYWGIAGALALLVWGLPRVVKTGEIYDNFTNTVIIATGAVLISVAIGSVAGYALARYTGISGIVILLAAIVFRSLPRLGYILPFYQVGQDTGLWDTYWLVIIVLVAINQPFTIWMMRAFFMTVPREIENAAMVDGATRFGAFWRVVIPVVWPGIIATSLFMLLLVYHEFILISILTQSKQTLTVAMAQFIGGVSVPGSVPRQSAAAVISVIPLVIVVLIFQKQFVRGIGAGAVKG